jgi:tight adherence protein C
MNFLFDTLSSIISPLPGLLSAWWPAIVVFVVAVSAFLLIARIWRRKPSPEEIRLRQIGHRTSDEPETGEGVFGPLTPALAAQIPETKRERRDFQRLLRQAGLYRPSARTTIYALRFVLMLLPLIVAGVWAVMAEADQTWKILGMGIFAAACFSVVPRLYVFFRRRRRMQRIRHGLADTIDMMSMCTSGGLGLSESLQHVAGQLSAYPELAQELLILKRQAEVGSLKQALADFSARVDLPEVRQLAGLLTRGTQLGTQLASSLNEQADHLRTARRLAATAQANKTPAKLVLPVLFCFAPAALILLTAPAVLDLHDFLVPSEQVAAEAAPGEVFSTGRIVTTLQQLEQPSAPTVVGPASTYQEPEY